MFQDVEKFSNSSLIGSEKYIYPELYIFQVGVSVDLYPEPKF